jgi:FAD/FMN-containing dehydrogenase
VTAQPTSPNRPAGFLASDRRRSWGRVARGLEYVAAPRFQDEAVRACAAAVEAGMTLLAGGLGRAYGDSGLNAGGAVIDMRALDRVLAFDAQSGVLRAEAGLSLDQLIRRVTPHGWFPPTTPGTRFVTLGGAVANDVHGKNHHRSGTLGCWVRRLGLWRSDRGLLELSPENEPELFAATLGGMGLTGAILWVELQLVRIGSAWLDEETVPFQRLDEFFALACDSEAGFEHTVAWIDCTARGDQFGRGLFSRGNWRDDGRYTLHAERPRRTLPLDLPNAALNPLTLKLFNARYYNRGKSRPRFNVEHYAGALYPLDAIGQWNRLYGPRGFYQYQCVVPPETAPDAVAALLDQIASSGQGSFLAVLKTFGAKASPGLMSFPMPGATLAMDFPNLGDATHALFGRLDDIVRQAGGRLYPAKDGRMPPAMLCAGYPNLERFAQLRDPNVSSSFWRRSFHG